MKAEKIEKLCWWSLLVFVLVVWVGLFTYWAHGACKNGYNNLRVVQVWIPETAKVVTAEQFEAVSMGTNSLDEWYENLPVHFLDQYKKMITDQTVYVTFGVDLHSLVVKYKMKVGQVWVDCRENYSATVGAALVKSITYLGDGKVEILTSYSKDRLCKLSVWYMLASAFWALVSGVVVLFAIGLTFVSKLLEWKQEREWKEEAITMEKIQKERSSRKVDR
jgi:hypothetical protein